ncbi:putative ribonuclease H-like domain-containing protein [Tanacetum coccineum]
MKEVRFGLEIRQRIEPLYTSGLCFRIWESVIDQMDVKYPKFPKKVYKVVKALYGLHQALVYWFQCKKQTIMATSTTEAEYVVAANCCGQNPVFHSKTKHIEIRHHFIRDAYEKKLIQVLKIHTNDNVGDLLTKAFDVSGGKTKEVKLIDDTKVVEDKGSGDKGGNAEELVSTARPEVSIARPDIDAARQEDSAVEPRTPPTTTSIFDDEDITMAQTLIKMKEEKAKEKGVSFKDIEDSSRPKRSILTLKPLLTIDPKDKGKSVLEEPEPAKKMTKSDFDATQIARDSEIARQLQVDLQAEVERERQREEKASKAVIAEMYDEVQSGIDADALFAAKLQ